MTDAPAAFQATFCGFRSVGSRKMTALTLEVPVEHSERVLKVLGHPDPLNPRWFAIALLDENAAAQAQGANAPVPNQSSPVNTREKRNWTSVSASEQAGMRCADAAFRRFLSEAHGVEYPEKSNQAIDSEIAAKFVRSHCGVDSRSILNTSFDAAQRWGRLSDAFDAWMRAAV